MTSCMFAFRVLEEFGHAYNTYTKESNHVHSKSISFFKIRWCEALRISCAETFLETFKAVLEDQSKQPQVDKSVKLTLCARALETLTEEGRLAEATISFHHVSRAFGSVDSGELTGCTASQNPDPGEGTGNSSLQTQNPSRLSTLSDRFDRIRTVIQFFSGDPSLVVESNSGWCPTAFSEQGDAPQELRYARQQIFHLLGLLCRVDLSRVKGLRPLWQALQIVQISGQASSICDIAVSQDRKQDSQWQEAKMYANLVLISLSCCCFILSQIVVDPKANIFKPAVEEMNLNRPKRKALERRKVTKHAMCLLESFNQLCIIEPQGTASNWPRIQCALFAACIVEMTRNTYTQLELNHLQQSLTQFRQNLLNIDRADIANAIETSLETLPVEADHHQSSQGRKHVRILDSRGKTRLLYKQRKSAASASPDIARQSLMKGILATESLSNSQSLAMVAYRDVTAHMMNRSSSAPYIWHTVIPELSLQHRCVRYAMLASAISSKMLIVSSNSTPEDYNSQRMQVTRWTSRAIRDALSGSAPTNAILMMSLLLSCVDLLNGQLSNAIIHVQHGFRIAELKGNSDPNDNVLAYCRSFMDSLQQTQECDPSDSTSDRRHCQLAQAIASFHLAIRFFERLSMRVRKARFLEKRKVCELLTLAQTEMKWLLSKWSRKLLNECGPVHAKTLLVAGLDDKKLLIMPWFAALKPLHQSLLGKQQFDALQFEVAMERTMPFFTMAKAGCEQDLREDAAELMMRGPILRGKTKPP